MALQGDLCLRKNGSMRRFVSEKKNKKNKSTANGTKYARQIFKEATILTFD
jgi:hypothetical protein